MFSFGRIPVQITGSTALETILPSSWQRYKVEVLDASNQVVLNVNEASLLLESSISNNWVTICDGDKQRVMYFDEGKARFALEYETCSSYVKVLHPKLQYRSALIGIQFGMLIALHQQCVGLHGVTLLCKNEIVILSASSGTGKTTLAHLLETYCDAIVINGDFAMLSSTPEGVYFEPTPFCGTSGRCLNHRVRVNRIVFLEQGKTNQWRVLTGREAMIQLMNNAFVPTWDDQMRKAVQDNIIKCTHELKLNMYSFVPTHEAAERLFEHLH